MRLKEQEPQQKYLAGFQPFFSSPLHLLYEHMNCLLYGFWPNSCSNPGFTQTYISYTSVFGVVVPDGASATKSFEWNKLVFHSWLPLHNNLETVCPVKQSPGSPVSLAKSCVGHVLSQCLLQAHSSWLNSTTKALKEPLHGRFPSAPCT